MTAALEGATLTPLAQLKPAPWNPRKIKDDRFKNLCASIEADPDFLRLRPILAMADGTIYAGNMRYRAAQQLGQTEAWAIVEDVPDQLAKERALRDNAAWGENVKDQLSTLVAELREAGSDITLLGFDDAQLERLLGSVTELEAEDDDVDLSPPAVAKSQPGDLYLLGEHRLMCGSSSERQDLDRLMAGDLADCVWTDPPYGVDYVGKTADSLTIQNDGKDNLYDMLATTFGLADAFMRAGCCWYIASPAGPNETHFRNAIETTGWLHHQTLVWVKSSMVMGHSDYHYQHEDILYGWKKGAAHTFYGDRSQVTVIDDDVDVRKLGKPELLDLVKDLRRALSSSVQREDKPHRNGEHPTMKPVELVRRQLANSSKRGDIVLELFGGSGTTLIAAQQLERRARVMELDPRYCDVIVRRWEQLTGGKAVRATDESGGLTDRAAVQQRAA